MQIEEIAVPSKAEPSMQDNVEPGAPNFVIQ
jgi:hypothetical protein